MNNRPIDNYEKQILSEMKLSSSSGEDDGQMRGRAGGTKMKEAGGEEEM